VIDPETARSVDIGEPGSILVTPFPPYGETTLLLRYDTEDMACRVAEPLACDLRTLPATTDLLGKRRLSVCHADGWTFPRDGSTSKPKHEGIAHQHVMPRDFSGAVTP
jgi:hypothetical protein